MTDKQEHIVEVKEIEGTGMVREPMTFAYVFHDGKFSSRDEVKQHLKGDDF